MSKKRTKCRRRRTRDTCTEEDESEANAPLLEDANAPLLPTHDGWKHAQASGEDGRMVGGNEEEEMEGAGATERRAKTRGRKREGGWKEGGRSVLGHAERLR